MNDFLISLRVQIYKRPLRLNVIAFYPERPKWDQNPTYGSPILYYISYGSPPQDGFTQVESMELSSSPAFSGNPLNNKLKLP